MWLLIYFATVNIDAFIISIWLKIVPLHLKNSQAHLCFYQHEMKFSYFSFTNGTNFVEIYLLPITSVIQFFTSRRTRVCISRKYSVCFNEFIKLFNRSMALRAYFRRRKKLLYKGALSFFENICVLFDKRFVKTNYLYFFVLFPTCFINLLEGKFPTKQDNIYCWSKLMK